MKQRLASALSSMIEINPDDSWLSRQNSMLCCASISTIHSFCFDLLRNNINQLSLSSGFRIIDETEENVLRIQAYKNISERFYNERYEDMITLRNNFCVNDDKPLLHITDSGVTAYGTPWDGKHRLSTNTAVPLKGICILTRDTTNHIEQAEPNAVYPMIVQQTNRSLTADGMKQTLSLIDRMLNVVPVYRLGCNMDIEAARVAYEGMQYRIWY